MKKNLIIFALASCLLTACFAPEPHLETTVPATTIPIITVPPATETPVTLTEPAKSIVPESVPAESIQETTVPEEPETTAPAETVATVPEETEEASEPTSTKPKETKAPNAEHANTQPVETIPPETLWQHCQEKQLIDDYVQEVWTRLLLHQPRLMTLSHEQRMTYISTTVINLFREEARKRRISTCSLDSIPLYTSGGIDALCNHFDAKITQREFLQLWYQVDADSREILERKILLEESNEEIGCAMNISTNSVRMYLTRAKRAASKVFTPHIRNFI